MTPRQLRKAKLLIGVATGTSFGMSVAGAVAADRPGNEWLSFVLFLWSAVLLLFGVAGIMSVGKAVEESGDDGGVR